MPKPIVLSSSALSLPESNLIYNQSEKSRKRSRSSNSPESPKTQTPKPHKPSKTPKPPKPPKTPKTPKPPKPPKSPKTPKTPAIPNTSKGKRKASVFLKGEREVFSKEYDFKIIQEYPSSISPPPPKRRRTPKVLLDLVSYDPNCDPYYDPHPMLAELPEEDIFVPLSILQPLPPVTPRKRSRKGSPQRDSFK